MFLKLIAKIISNVITRFLEKWLLARENFNKGVQAQRKKDKELHNEKIKELTNTRLNTRTDDDSLQDDPNNRATRRQGN